MASYQDLNSGYGDDQLESIKKNIDSWDSYWSDNNQYYENKLAFLNGDQWDTGTQNYFALAKIPMMVVPFIKLFVKQLIGELVQNIPSLEVIPQNMYVDQEKIDLFQDMIRTAFINSNGEEQLQRVCEMIMCGFGVMQVGTEYISFDSFQQRPYFKFINDPQCGGFDPSAELPTKSDGDYCFRRKYMTKTEWEREYPDIPFESRGFGSISLDQFSTFTQNKGKETCVIAEYYEKKYKNVRYVKVSPTIDGTPYAEMEEKEFEQYLQDFLEMTAARRIESELMGIPYMTPSLPRIIERKTDKKYKIKCYICREDRILEEHDWIGKELPLIYVDGDSVWVKGQQVVRAIFDGAIDLQRALNYQWSFLIQFMKTSMKGKVFATPEQMKGFEKIYENPELYHGAIPYNWVQTVAGPPHTIDAPQLKQEILMAIQQTTQSLMSILGRQEAVMGINPGQLQSNPTSGKAYEKMAIQQNNTCYIQANNLWNSVKQVGVIFLDIFPKLYTDLEVITVYDKDFQHKQIQINGKNKETGQQENMLVPIRATVTVSPSASFEMQKEMERNYLITLLQAGAANPQVFALVADQFAQLSETSITPTIVRRLKTIVPPQALMADNGKEFQPQPPQPDPMVMLKKQELDLKAQEIQQTAQTKAAEHQLEVAKLQQQKLDAIIDAHKNNVKTNAELKKAHISLAETLTTAQHKIEMARESRVNKST